MKRAKQGGKSKRAGGKNKNGNGATKKAAPTKVSKTAKGKHPGLNPETVKQRAEVAKMIKSPVVTLRWYQITSNNGEIECNPYVDLDLPPIQILYTDEMRKLPHNQIILLDPLPEPVYEVPEPKMDSLEYGLVNVALDNLDAFVRTPNPQRDAMMLTNVGLGLHGTATGNLGKLHRGVYSNCDAYDRRDFTKLAAEFCSKLMGRRLDEPIDAQVPLEMTTKKDCVLSPDSDDDPDVHIVAAVPTKESKAMDAEIVTVKEPSEITEATQYKQMQASPEMSELLAKCLYNGAVKIIESAPEIVGSIQFRERPVEKRFAKLVRQFRLVVGEHCFRPLQLVCLPDRSKTDKLFMVKYFHEIGVMSADMSRFKSVTIAAAAILLVFHLLGIKPPRLQQFTALQARTLRAVAKQVAAWVRVAPTAVQKHVYWKLKKREFDGATNINLIYDSLMKTLD